MINGKRRIVFSMIMVAVPLLVLVLVEFLLRWSALFVQEPLLVQVQGTDGSLIGFNPYVGRRYIDASPAAMPFMNPEVFQYAKSGTTFRVLCLGEGSTEGFPFACQVPFPRQLRQLLTEAYPERHIEVLNAGMSGVSSYVLVDLLPELLASSPDLVVVYAGHNEFYGAYGSGSALYPAGHDTFVRAALAVQKTRLGQMVRWAVAWLRSSPTDSVPPDALWEQAADDQRVSRDTARYEQTRNSFRRNLERIADACRARGIPVMFGTLVSNDRDVPPFHSRFDPAGFDGATVRQRLHNAEELLHLGKWQEALTECVPVVDRDPHNADACFTLARALMMKGDTSAARELFIRARNDDSMRLRAPADFNAIIAEVARDRGAKLVDVADIFAARSPGKIIGNEWVCDHVHPTPQGHYVMAAAFFVGIQHMHILPPPDSSFHPRGTAYGVTALDWDMGMMKIFLMNHHWPFRSKPVRLDEYTPTGDSTTARIAWEFLNGHTDWPGAHNAMAEEYLRRGKGELARREYEAIAVNSPENPWPFQMIAESYGIEKNWPLRSAALREALRRPGPQGLLAYQLGLCEMEMQHTAKAIRAMGVAAEAPECTLEERQTARLHLASLIAGAGQSQDAIAVLRVMLRDDSTSVPARRLLSSLERSK